MTRIVLDTNILVSAMRSPAGTPARVLRAVLTGELLLLYDAQIMAEYREVPLRRKFSQTIAPQYAETILAMLEAAGELVHVHPWPLVIPDPKDLPFLEVALAGEADAIITGNGRDYPATCGARVLSPAEALAELVR